MWNVVVENGRNVLNECPSLEMTYIYTLWKCPVFSIIFNRVTTKMEYNETALAPYIVPVIVRSEKLSEKSLY